ncbi:hypothetical protein QBC36DRAFT_62079 [Triangularia setosa]|uniref:Uncharacterized protein n=1 Tax=Triangularia setosa TaxID=2587417 RepID=A0AAN6W3T5_9PEZI|nr:hypothetical protein QBC36DRAFT_62079 [Podospora setosa]
MSTTKEETIILLQELKATLNTSQRSFVFAYGGSIPILSPNVKPSDTNTDVHLDPVALRWDPRNSSTLASQCKITFPQELNKQHDILLPTLVANMLLATFGLGGKEAYDEKYRKALKLDGDL